MLARDELEERLLLRRVERQPGVGDPVEEAVEDLVGVVRPAGRDAVRERRERPASGIRAPSRELDRHRPPGPRLVDEPVLLADDLEPVRHELQEREVRAAVPVLVERRPLLLPVHRLDGRVRHDRRRPDQRHVGGHGRLEETDRHARVLRDLGDLPRRRVRPDPDREVVVRPERVDDARLGLAVRPDRDERRVTGLPRDLARRLEDGRGSAAAAGRGRRARGRRGRRRRGNGGTVS